MKPPRITFDSTWRRRLLGRGSSWERAIFVLALVLASTALGGVAWQAHTLDLEQTRLRAAVLQAQVVVARPAPRPVQTSTPLETLRQMDRVTGRLNVPWTDLFDAIERTASQKVALLTLEPDARTGSIALTAEARSLDDLLSYAEALGQDPAVAVVRMAQHDLRAQEPGQPVRMILSVSPNQLRQ